MVFYICELCDFSSNQKNDFTRHLNTKKHKNNDKNYQEECIKCDEKGLKKDSKRAFVGEKRTQKGLKKDSKRTQNKLNKFECEYCGMLLKDRPILLRHIRKFCKEKKRIIEEKKNNNLIITEQKEHINKLMDNLGNNINNQTNINNTINNVQLNCYNNVDKSMLTDNFKNRMIKGPFTMIPKAMKAIYFNKKYPENKVIKMINRKDNILQVHKKDGWEYVEKEDVIDEIIDNTNYEIDTYYENKPKKFTDFVNKTYKRFRDLYESNDDKLWNKIKRDVDLLLWNNMN
jgi:hypothetical protein